MTLVFNRWSTPKVIRVPAPQTIVTIQELVNACRAFEADLFNLDLPKMLNAEGKTDLQGGKLTGISATLLDDWQLEFEARAGPDVTRCYVRDGNLTAINSYGNNPIKYSAFTFPTIELSTSAALINEAVTDDLTFLKKLTANKREIIGNTIVFYDDDGHTVIHRMNLFDVHGAPTPGVRIFKAEPV